MSDNGIIQPGVPLRFEWRNFRRVYRERTIGPVYAINIEISAEDWATLETMPRNSDGEMVMWVTEVVEGPKTEEEPLAMDNGKKTQPRLKEPKGRYSYFWEYLNPNSGKGGSGFATLPGVREAIEERRITETEPVWELLHRVFGVGGGTLAETGPDEVLAKFPGNSQVALAVERAMKFQRDKEARQ